MLNENTELLFLTVVILPVVTGSRVKPQRGVVALLGRRHALLGFFFFFKCAKWSFWTIASVAVKADELKKYFERCMMRR